MSEKKSSKRHSPVDAWETAALGLDSDIWLRKYRLASNSADAPLEALAFYRSVFDEAPVAMVVTTMQLVVTDANRAAQQLLGRTQMQLRRMPFSRYVVMEERRIFSEMVELVQAEDRISRPIRLQLQRGKEIEVVVTAKAIGGAASASGFVLLMLSDRGDAVTSDML